MRRGEVEMLSHRSSCVRGGQVEVMSQHGRRGYVVAMLRKGTHDTTASQRARRAGGDAVAAWMERR